MRTHVTPTRIHALILTLLSLLLIMPITAQDIPTPVAAATDPVTLEAAPTILATATPGDTLAVDMGSGGGDVNIFQGPSSTGETPAPESPTPPSSAMSPLLELVLGLSAILVAVSFAAEKLGNRARAVTQDPVSMSIAERLGDSTPSIVVLPLVGAMERVTQAMANVTELLRKATDGVPEASKPAAPLTAQPPVSPTAALTTPGGGNWPASPSS